MSANLKDQVRPALIWVLVVNFLVFVAIVTAQHLRIDDIALDSGLVERLVPAGVAVILCGVLVDQIGPITKARLVFLRWSDPLPGSRAFTELAALDPRVNLKPIFELTEGHTMSPREQNALWYNLYKEHEESVSVIEAHRSYLFSRDYAALSFLMLVIFGSLAILFCPNVWNAMIYVTLLIAQFLVVRRAAAVAGHRMVTNVLALASVSGIPTESAGRQVA